MAEALLIYQPRTGQLYYQIGEKFYDAHTLRETPPLSDFGMPVIRIRGDQNWPLQPVFIRTTNGWSVENAIDEIHFGVIAQSSLDVINQPILNFKVFEIPNLTHANVHADGSESLEPIQYDQKFSPLLARILHYLKENRLPAIYDVRNRPLILRAIAEGA